MNIHPMIVHFPIALLTIYSVLELIRIKKVLEKPWFKYVKGAFVIIGSLSSSLALSTGEMAEELYEKSELKNLIETHSAWAGFATYVFAILAIIYAIHFISESTLNEKIQKTFLRSFWNFLTSISEKLFTTTWLMMTAAFVGLVALTVTGGLGGAIVYGPDVDPIVKIIYTTLVR